MAIRSNHYDAAFEEFLRSRRAAYVAVDEKRRALVGDDSLKSLDFIVETASQNLLVDVKGRRFGGTAGRWENWATEDDLRSMTHWQSVFGPQFRAALVFVYWLDDASPPPVDCDRFVWREKQYAVVVAMVDDYAEACRTRSSSWGTVSVPRKRFREMTVPIGRFLDVPAASTSHAPVNEASVNGAA